MVSNGANITGAKRTRRICEGGVEPDQLPLLIPKHDLTTQPSFATDEFGEKGEL